MARHCVTLLSMSDLPKFTSFRLITCRMLGFCITLENVRLLVFCMKSLDSAMGMNLFSML